MADIRSERCFEDAAECCLGSSWLSSIATRGELGSSSHWGKLEELLLAGQADKMGLNMIDAKYLGPDHDKSRSDE